MNKNIFFLSEPRVSLEWAPIVGGTFKPVPQLGLIPVHTGSACKG